ncbi:hypothetical protein [Rhodococcus sp. NPDC006774]|uniref:hypothetical protein n=1 Tax=Rhodococcus sp. NPDC006774 TaxID=3157186 RepID=UPI0033D5B6FB
MHTDSISVTLDEAVTRLEDIVGFHAPSPDGCGSWTLERLFRSLPEGGYGTNYKAVVHVPHTWPGLPAGIFWLEASSNDPVDALDKLADLIITKAPVAA